MILAEDVATDLLMLLGLLLLLLPGLPEIAESVASPVRSWLRKRSEGDVVSTVTWLFFAGVVLIVLGVAPTIYGGIDDVWQKAEGKRHLLVALGTLLFALPSLAVLSRRAKAQELLAKNQQDLAKHQQRLADNQAFAEANERFSRSIDQLGATHKVDKGSPKPNIEVRLGGLYTLGELAQENTEKFHSRVLSILCAYVRENTESVPQKELATAKESAEAWPSDPTLFEELESPREDVQTALMLIGSRKRQEGEPSIDLSGRRLCLAHLERADLKRADLEGADLRKANLEKAYLGEAKLEKVHLEMANLQDADLEGADLQGAHLERADLKRAKLGKANLNEVDLRLAFLSDADLREAHLERVDLRKALLHKADLRKAFLWDADLREAHLAQADLRDADLEGVDIEGAFLQWANLEGASGLPEAKLRQASVNECTTFPDGKRRNLEELRQMGQVHSADRKDEPPASPAATPS